MNTGAPSRGLRLAAAIAAGSLVLGAAGAARADVKTSLKCRSTIAKTGAKLVATDLKGVDGCHKTKNKAPGADSGLCNVIAPGANDFDPKAKYQATRDKLNAAIEKPCTGALAADILTLFSGGDFDDALFKDIEAAVQTNSAEVLGTLNLGGDKAKVKCHAAVAKIRSKHINTLIKNASKCQAALDKTASSFPAGIADGCLQDSAIDPAAKSATKANDSLVKSCPGLTGADVGACEPLTNPGSCVVAKATETAKALATAIYKDVTTCEPVAEFGAPTTRNVRVVINTPTPLQGVQVTVDYPKFLAGVPGVADSPLVQNSVAYYQGGGPDTGEPAIIVPNDVANSSLRVVLGDISDLIENGDGLEVLMDSCVPPSLNVCNRAVNVYGCCEAAGLPGTCGAGVDAGEPCLFNSDCDSAVEGDHLGNCNASCASGPPVCSVGSFPTTSAGRCTPDNDGCPGDNACQTQTDATQCSITGPTDANAQPVLGVTCTVTIL